MIAAKEIVEGMRKVDASEVKVRPQFAAIKLDRLPQYGPEELDLTSLVVRLRELERHCQRLDGQMAEYKKTVTTLAEDHARTAVSYAMATKRGEAAQEIVQRPAKVVMAARPAHPKTATMASLPDRKRKMTPAPVEGERMRSSAIDTYVAKETPTANETPTAKETTTANETPTAKETTTANDAPPANSLQGDRDDDVQLPRSQRRRNDRRNKRAVFGTKGGTELKGGERNKEIFIFNLESGTTADAISEYMNRANVTSCEVECKSNEESRLKSFRVRVKDTQYGTAMMADMWPQNVGCRPYFRSRARPNRSDEFSGDM